MFSGYHPNLPVKKVKRFHLWVHQTTFPPGDVEVCILAGALVFKANQESGGKALGSGVLKGEGRNGGPRNGGPRNGGDLEVFFLGGGRDT